MIEVNLLPAQKVASPRELFARRVLLGLLGAVLAILVFDLVIFFLFQQLFKRQVADLTSMQSDLTTQAKQYSLTTSSLLTVERKAAGIVVVRSFRRDVATIISDVLKILVDGVELGNLQVEATGSVFFDAKATSVESLGRFIGKINEQVGSTHLTKVVLTNLRQDSGGNYIFQVAANYVPSK